MISIMNDDVEQFGRDSAVAAATRDAWHIVVDKGPERSIALHSVMIDTYDQPGPYAYRYRYVFEVD